MGCCKPRTSSPPPPPPPSPPQRHAHREEVVLTIPNASVHLLEAGEAVELARGDLEVITLSDQGVALATVVKVDRELQWPLAKDEPVVKLDRHSYLFTLPDKGDGGFLNYGVSLPLPDDHRLDSFLQENACFSAAAPSGSSSSSSTAPLEYPRSSGEEEECWRRYAPRVEDYNGVLAKAIAGGTGKIVEGIFTCSSTYSNQVHRGADLMQPQAPSKATGNFSDSRTNSKKKVANNSINKSIRRVRKLSEMTEKMSKSLLNGVLTVTGTVAVPVVRSKAGKAVLGSLPGEVMLASLDAIGKVLDAVEAAERKTIAATGGAASRVVSKRFGENAGQATDDVFATAGHTVGTAWNIFKIRKAITPSSNLPSKMVKNAVARKT